MVTKAQSGRAWRASILPTALHGATAGLSLANRWVEWGDYTVAREYTSWEDEYEAIRRHAGIADLSPAIHYRVSGDDAFDYLNRLVTRDLNTLAVNGTLISPFCNRDGLVIDIMRIERLDAHEFRLFTTYQHLLGCWTLPLAMTTLN